MTSTTPDSINRLPNTGNDDLISDVRVPRKKLPSSVLSRSQQGTNYADVDELVDGIDRVHIDHQRAARHSTPTSQDTTPADPNVDFPRLYKVYPCPTGAACCRAGAQWKCFYYHDMKMDRRRVSVAYYSPHMCRSIEGISLSLSDPSGCPWGDGCRYAHNDIESRYHPDRFGQETCRDYLRGVCPRRYCAFRHQVSDKVQTAIEAIHVLTDTELQQLVPRLSDPRRRVLSEILVRRPDTRRNIPNANARPKKNYGWKLDGFNPRGRDDQKVKFVTARVEEVKKSLRDAGERKWAATLKTSSLRDMMSGVRKVAEEIRERCYKSQELKEGDNPFLVTPDNQNEAMTALERLVEKVIGNPRIGGSDSENAVPAGEAE